MTTSPIRRVLGLGLLLAGLLPSPSLAAERIDLREFPDPIDALSVTMASGGALEVSGFVDGRWTPWETLSVEESEEADPTLRESNLVTFPAETTRIRLRGGARVEAIHPIRISSDPITYEVAATVPISRPKILSRKQWGADDSFLVRGEQTKRSDVDEDVNGGGEGNGNGTLSQRMKDCEEAQRDYPKEFKAARTVTTTPEGERLRWPWQYSQKIHLIAVHHTAMKVEGDTRSGVERVRAIYAYHANNRGWGDIGYHYVIDEEGQIYEGKAGGDYVVGGHAYCNNIGTLGVALMGNFELEKPTQAQMKSLQWLLDALTKQYDIDPSKNVVYHGKTLPPIVGHRQLVSTTCPGFYVAETLDQVRMHVAAGTVNVAIKFPKLPTLAGKDMEKRKLVLPPGGEGLIAMGPTSLTGRPGGEVTLTLRYQASDKSLPRRSSVARILRTDPSLLLHQRWEKRRLRVRNDVLLPAFVPAGGSALLHIDVTVPEQKGTYRFAVGNIPYTLKSEGRRVRTGTIIATDTGDHAAALLPDTPPAPTFSSQSSGGPLIRIRLSYGLDTLSDATSATIERVDPDSLEVYEEMALERQDDHCVLRGRKMENAEVVRIDPNSDLLTITSWRKPNNRFRGILECRVIDGRMTLINELPLESYVAGIGEEPDTEPEEKQRAFAVAARTYAAFYLQPSQRKFPGMPYDGSDSPASFQLYGGHAFETKNPHWAKAVKSTAGNVLLKDGQIIKPPYFSSDDGRTRSPDEAGWKTYPFKEIFVSKPDPWCEGEPNRGHLVGMSGCGSEGQADEGRTGEEILQYYYPGTTISALP